MPPRNRVRISYYRWEGRFLFFRIKERCRECDMTYAVLQQLLADVFQDKPVSLDIKPWLDNWWKILWRGAWHAPIVMVNGRVFSQGVVPDVHALVRTAAGLLHGDELAARADEFARKEPPAPARAPVIVYHSPACPHCRKLIPWLRANGIDFDPRDVSHSDAARQELADLTGKMSIPVVQAEGEVVVGFDKPRLRDLLGIDPAREKQTPTVKEVAVPQVDPESLAAALEKAKSVLAGNRADGKTRASLHLYPHQWNWDAGFIARGYLHFDPEQAYREIRALFSGQWTDGFLPHIIFNPSYLDHFPGPDYWQAQRSGRVPAGVHTSGISQPPVHASMLAPAVGLDPDPRRARAFLEEIYPSINALYTFFLEHRDPHDEGLVCLVHPWESGIDNAPIWDEPLSNVTGSSPWARAMQERYDELARAGDRPKRSYIEKYSFLVESLFTRDFDWRAISSSHPFLIQDVLFNAVLCQAERDLASIAEIIGRDLAVERFAEPGGGDRWIWEVRADDLDAAYWRIPCGGTHVARTGELGRIKLKRKNIGKGKERVEVTLLD